MTQQPQTHDTTECGLHSFERNRFFHGKLMTARDMEAEQRYHRNRLRVLAQHVLGEGIVCGLETTVEADDETLSVSIEPGLAFDSCGHPIVVETAATEDIDLDEVPDPASLYISYDDCVRESVPVPGSEDACGEECTYNRVLEIFAIEARSPPEEFKRVREIDFPGPDEFGGSGTPDPENDALRQIATSYAEGDDGTLHSCASGGEDGIYLGRFATGTDDEWSRVTDAESRAHVYTNDMLYAAIARHAADFDNPHEVTAAQTGALVSVEGVSNPGGDVALNSSDGSVSVDGDDAADSVDLRVADRIQDKLSDLAERVNDLEERLGAMERQLLKSTLHHKRLSFRLLAERFDAPAAEDVVETTSEAIDNDDHEEVDAYIEFANDALEDEQEVVEELAGVDAVSEVALDRYDEAVEELEDVLGDAGDVSESEQVHRVAHAQGLVAETAEWIESQGRVEEPPEEPQFSSDSYSTESGGTVDIGLATGDAEDVLLRIGDDQTNYRLAARFRPEPPATVTVSFDTSAAGSGESLTASPDVGLEIVEEPSIDGPLDTGSYPLELAVPGPDGFETVDVASLQIQQPESGSNQIEQSIADTERVFSEVADTFDSGAAREIVQFAGNAIEAGVSSESEYRQFVSQLTEGYEELIEELVNVDPATEASLGDFARAVTELDRAATDGAPTQMLLARQDDVLAAADGLAPLDDEFDPVIRPGEYETGDPLRDAIQQVETVEQAEAVLAHEIGTDDRTAATGLIVDRIRELEGS